LLTRRINCQTTRDKANGLCADLGILKNFLSDWNSPLIDQQLSQFRIFQNAHLNHQEVKGWVGIIMVLALSIINGCHGRVKSSPPLVQVLSVNVVEQTKQGARLDVRIGVENPSLVALPLIRAQYTVTIEAAGTFTLTDQLNRTVPAGVENGGSPVGRQIVNLPVAITLSSDWPVSGSYIVQGELFYHRGRSFFSLLPESEFDLQGVIFEGSGQIEHASVE